MRLLNLVTWAAAFTSVEAARMSVGISADNQATHYQIHWIDTTKHSYGAALAVKKHVVDFFSNGNCNVTYDKKRQNEYDIKTCATFYKCSTSKDYFSQEFSVEVCRGFLQPILPKVEECLSDVVDDAYEILEDEFKKNREEERKQNAKIFATIACATIGFFAMKKVVNQVVEKIEQYNTPTPN